MRYKIHDFTNDDLQNFASIKLEIKNRLPQIFYNKGKSFHKRRGSGKNGGNMRKSEQIVVGVVNGDVRRGVLLLEQGDAQRGGGQRKNQS